MAVTVVRTFIIFTALFVIMRLMGKRQIGEMQPYEFIITLIIADLACVPMSDVSIPLTYGIISILELFILHQLLSIIESFGSKFKKIISGKPSIVIDKNGINLKELKRNNLGVEDLIESMRALGYFSFDQLDYAIFESNGKLSALENTSVKSNSLPVILVSDGKQINDNLIETGISLEKLKQFFISKNCTIKDIEVMTIDGNGKVYLKQKRKKFDIFNIKLNGEKQW